MFISIPRDIEFLRNFHFHFTIPNFALHSYAFSKKPWKISLKWPILLLVQYILLYFTSKTQSNLKGQSWYLCSLWLTSSSTKFHDTFVKFQQNLDSKLRKLEMKISLDLDTSVHQNSCNFKYFLIVMVPFLCLTAFFIAYKRVRNKQ